MTQLKQICSLLHYILYLNGFHAIILSFNPSAISDEFCLDQFSLDENIIKYDSLPSYCDDIDNILTDYCGNTAFYTSIHPNYNALDTTDDECIFYLEDQQIITKTYVISDQIPINRITFASNNTSHLSLSQSFLSITSYHGSINILNLHFSSNSNTFSFMDIASNNIALDITLILCHFVDMNADNGSIINMPHNDHTQYSKAINITFDNCIVERTNSQYGGILYIERNNVYVTFSECDINDIGVYSTGSGAIIHWLCQLHNNLNDLCGEVLISHTNITQFDDNLFTIDLSLDPSQIHFVLNVDTSIFTNINGSIFNFNHNDDALGPYDDRIQEQNAFLHINNSWFEDNGLSYTNNGTIFTINSFTVPSITIENSNFTHNAALCGTIFYWFCSRNVRWTKDNYCGSVILTNNLFEQNKIDSSPYFPRYGSLMYIQIRDNMQFDLWMDQTSFIQHSGNLIYLEESTALLPSFKDDFTNGNFSNYTTNSNTNYTMNTSAIDSTNIESLFSMIFLQDSQFIECDDILSISADYNLLLYIFITRSLFEANECNADECFKNVYTEDIYITDSLFEGKQNTTNTATTSAIATTESTTDADSTTLSTTSTTSTTESTTESTTFTSTNTTTICDNQAIIDWEDACVPDPEDGCAVILDIEAKVCVVNGVMTRNHLRNSVRNAMTVIIKGLRDNDVVCSTDAMYLHEVLVQGSHQVAHAAASVSPQADNCPVVVDECGTETNDEPQFDVAISLALRCGDTADDCGGLQPLAMQLYQLAQDGVLGIDFAREFLSNTEDFDSVCNIGLGRVAVENTIKVTLMNQDEDIIVLLEDVDESAAASKGYLSSAMVVMAVLAFMKY